MPWGAPDFVRQVMKRMVVRHEPSNVRQWLRCHLLIIPCFAIACAAAAAICLWRTAAQQLLARNTSTLGAADDPQRYRDSRQRYKTQHDAHGCAHVPLDTPVCMASNACFSDGVVQFYVSRFGKDQWPWMDASRLPSVVNASSDLEPFARAFEGRCCGRAALDLVEGGQEHNSCLRAMHLGFTCCKQGYRTNNVFVLMNDASSLRFLPEDAFIMDTAVGIFQFGHTISKILQLASINSWYQTSYPSSGDPSGGPSRVCPRPALSIGIFSRIKHRVMPSVAQQWLQLVATMRDRGGSFPKRLRVVTLTDTLFDNKQPSCAASGICPEMLPHPTPGKVCVQRAFFVLDYEKYYFRQTDADRLNTAADAELRLPTCPGKSAPRLGMQLLRTEGSGMRRMINAIEVEHLVNRLFGIRLKKVVIDSAMDARAQAIPFREHGFILSSHSSQLKHLALACPCTIALEVNAMDGTRAPFAVGLEHRSVVYVQSSDHIPESHGRPFDPLDFRDLRNLDIRVNLTRLEADLREAVARHRKSGCSVF